MKSKETIEAELKKAREAQAANNPGQARVCARRAAGWVVRAWYQRRDGPHWGGDALKQLRRLRDDDVAPEPIRQAAQRLTTKVDENHALPFDHDPVEDARLIITFAH